MTDSLVTDSCQIRGIGEAASIVAGLDFTDVLNDFRYDIANEKSAAFANQSTPDGEVWASLSKTTQKRKGLSPILVNTGALRASLVDVDGAETISELTSHELVAGTAIDYATFHETGTKFMPARPIIGTSTATLDRLAARVADATVAAIVPNLANAIGNVASKRT
jgi:phage gpG-like protein